MSEEEFLEQLFSDDDVPTDPEELLQFATHLYQLYKNAPEDSPIREIKEINWEEFGKILEKAQAADDNAKDAEAKFRQAEKELDDLLRSFLSYN